MIGDKSFFFCAIYAPHLASLVQEGAQFSNSALRPAESWRGVSEKNLIKMRGDNPSPLDPSAGGRGIFFKHTLINVKPPPQVLANHPRALIVCLLFLVSMSHAIVDDKDSNSTAPSSTTHSAWGTRGRSTTSPPQISCSPPKDDSGASTDIVGAVVGRRVAIPTPCSLLLHHLVVDAKKAGGSIPLVSDNSRFYVQWFGQKLSELQCSGNAPFPDLFRVRSSFEED